MKVGILTYHNSRNYGAVLQAYGLVYYLNSVGIDARIIDHKCNQIEKDLYDNYRKESLPKKIFYLKKKKEFDSFNKQNLSLYFTDDNQHWSYDFDAIIVGSDQVWNSRINGNDNAYFLSDFNGIRIAYAASCGDSVELSTEQLELISTFDFVSVREKILHEYLNKKKIFCELSCDPSILAGKNAFLKFSGKSFLKKKYVFVFMIWKSEKLLHQAYSYANLHGLKVVTNKSSLEFLLKSKPSDFINWISNAECVFTNSFHGTLFSLMFSKPLIACGFKENGKQNTRIEELMNMVGCNENLYYGNRDIVSVPIINYRDVKNKLDQTSSDSRSILNDFLKINDYKFDRKMT